MKKRIGDWSKKHIVGCFLFSLANFLLADVLLAMRYAYSLFDRLDYAYCVVLGLGTVLCLIFTSKAIREKKLERAVEMIFEEADKNYFHGFKLRRYVDTFAFWRFQKWLGSGRCYGMSVLAMILLKHNKTATIYRGDSIDKDGNSQTRHSWVEFKVPWNGWWVADFTWINTGIAPKKLYLKSVNANGGSLEVKWSCSYDEFWDTPFVNTICEAMRTQETSNIYRLLDAFGSPMFEEYGFTEYCYSETSSRDANCIFMIPYYDCDNKPMSSLIIRDFAKNPKRRHPKARSIRLTQFGIRKYEEWKAKQE